MGWVGCRRCRRLLPPYVEGELPGEAAGWVRRHLERCPSCRGAEQEERRLSAGYRHLFARSGAPPPPRALAVRRRQGAAPLAWRHGARRVAVVVVALLLAVLALSVCDRGECPGTAGASCCCPAHCRCAGHHPRR